MEEDLDKLYEEKEKIRKGGGEESIEKQHSRNKLTARERIDLLLDENSFVELNSFQEHRATQLGMDEKELPGDGVVTGYGTIDDRVVYVFAQDFTVMGGSLGEAHAEKISYVMDEARKVGAPVIGLNDSGGARIQEGVDSLKGYGDIFYRNTINSGVVPQITAILGPCAGGAVYSPAIGDFIFMNEENSLMFITGPDVIKSVTGEEISSNELGGAQAHARKSGMAHFVSEDDEDTLNNIRELISYIPSNNMEDPPEIEPSDDPNRKTDELYDLIPEEPKKSYDAKEVIETVVDEDSFFEVHPHFAQSMKVGFARMDGQSVGVVANNPAKFAGSLNIDASDKAARFIRFCDAYNIPIITFVDTPGYLPGVEQEHGGIIRHGAKLLYAYSEATVPLITTIVRKAYGGAYIAMASKHLKADQVFALPSSEIAVMGPEGAANIIYRREIKNADNPDEVRQEKIQEYRDEFANPYKAAKRGYIDDVVDPADLRQRIINSLNVYDSKREENPDKKHGNIPL